MKHKKQLIAWSITTVALAALMTTVGVLTSGNRVLDNVFDSVFGPDQAIADNGNTNVKEYNKSTKSKQEAKNYGASITKEINEEGIILLKNEGNTLPLKTDQSHKKISVFGKNSADPMLGGSGSVAGAMTDAEKKAALTSIYESFESAGFEVNPLLKAFYLDESKSGPKRDVSISMNGQADTPWSTFETPYSSYTDDIKNSYSEYHDAAIVVLARIGGEGSDLPRTASDNAEHHYLELDSKESELLNQVCASFDKVILVLNSNNPMELGFLKDTTDPNYHSQIKAALWCGGFGSTGVQALGEIVAGTVNPSGHTVDTFSKDFKKDPTWNNFGTNGTTDGDRYIGPDGKLKQYYFVHYEEGIYVGYRYYETRGLTDGDEWYNQNVVYPFGYGLSYTNFSWELKNEGGLGTLSKDKFKVEVEVENTGDVAGKDVVQIYVGAPYTAGGIEKSAKVLAGFAKTPLLQPKEKATVTVEVDPYQFASYDYNDANKNNFKGYELEAGDYRLYISHNAHDVEKTVTMSLATGIQYDTDPVTGNKVENRFDDVDDQLSTVLSRNDWEGTWPTTPTEEDRKLTQDEFNILKKFHTHNNPTATGHSAPTTGAVNYKKGSNGEIEKDADGNPIKLTIYDLIGADWDDERWDELLDMMTAQEMSTMFYNAAFNTAKAESIDKPATTNCDGPQGFTVFMGDPTVYGTNVYPSEPVVGATFNVELAEKEGDGFGEESLWGDYDKKGSGLTYSGIYAPAVNIHRNPFGGRYGEYYSEDPILNGKMAANLTQGASKKGTITYTKHFVGNEQETHRSSNGDCTWLTEQALREIYLKPFEIDVKEGHTVGIMTSFNRIGTTWAGGDYRLLTAVLRNEWGFHGAVICDFSSGKYMNSKAELYAGGNLNLATDIYDTDVTTTDPEDIYQLRQSTKEVLWSVVNSNGVSVKIIGYRPAIWKIVEWIIMGVISAGVIAWGVVLFILIRKPDKPDKTEE